MSKTDIDMKIEVNIMVMKKRIKDIWFLDKSEGNPEFPSLYLDDLIDFYLAMIA